MKLSRLLFLLLTALSLSVAVHSLKFTTGNTAHLSPEFADKYSAIMPVIIAHGISAIIALTIGPFQFIDSLRNRFRRAHRIAGRIYVIAVIVGSITGFRMGLQAHMGLPSVLAFCTMAILWFITDVIAWRTAMLRNFAAHRRWMIRNFALTFGAATFRLYLNALQYIGLDYDAIYPIVAWVAWVPNLVVAELIIRWKATSHKKT